MATTHVATLGTHWVRTHTNTRKHHDTRKQRQGACERERGLTTGFLTRPHEQTPILRTRTEHPERCRCPRFHVQRHWRARNSRVFRDHRAPKEWGAREEALRTKPIGWNPPGEPPRSKIAAGLGCCAFEVRAQALTEDALRHVSGHDPEDIRRSCAGAVPIPGLRRARCVHVVPP